MSTTSATLDAVGIAHRYIALWNETDAARRRQMLEAGWAEDACYVDPIAQASGHEEISTLVGVVHQRYPGFRFALTGQADAHGDNLRFSWTLGPSGAADLIQGTDFVQVDDGKLQSVTGFLDKVPTGA
jgi:SnoaL-like protein